ncbi:unnamed protein product [Tilletia controversa]|nr:hypothetical protein CF335_g3976 [Tilletia laevis]CAD6885701.1 unnamed protein product [Tilletia caries]CAD6899166.1 unnamed protein product [Tilletia controversa]CAD6931983.1 unnamed protein product [Tilletia controversa]CAD6936164.1 unnamed protein product [Tilletia controversa]
MSSSFKPNTESAEIDSSKARHQLHASHTENMAEEQVDGGRDSQEGTSNRSSDMSNGDAEVENGDGQDDAPNGKDPEDPLFNLGKALAAAKDESDEFSFGGSADFLPPVPGLFIEGVGKVALPLIDEQQAEKIVKICEPTPSEPELDTHVDNSIRSCWQLDSSKVKLQHPGWAAGIQKAESFIAEKFIVAGTPITLHLRKLLLQKADGALAKHRDTEKEDRTFATMIIQLPSAHKGGQLQVFNDGSEDPVIHDFGAAAGTAEYQCNYAVHYADAEHAVQPITEGYRLALVYSVCWPDNSTQAAPPVSREKQAPMRKALAELADANRDFHYYFEHAYTPKSISELGVGSLKGQDRARVATLRTANDGLPPHQRFNFYLVHAKRFSLNPLYRKGYYERSEESSSPTYSFTSILSLKGKPLTSSAIDLEDADDLNPDNLTDVQRWSSAYTTEDKEDYQKMKFVKHITHSKYVLLAWPAKEAEDKMLALVGLNPHFTGMLSAGADPDAVRNFVQRVVRLNAAGQFELDEETDFGQALYKHITSEPQLHDLYPIYFDMFPRGTHDPENLPRSSSRKPQPFIDIIQMSQQPRYWETLGGKIIDAFAGKTLLTLELLEAVRQSNFLHTETKRDLIKTLLELFRTPVIKDVRNDKTLRRKLWSAVLTSEGSESFKDLARTYVAHFPQGSYPNTYGTGRFEDLILLATSDSVWKAIRPVVLKGFEADTKGALFFVQLCKKRSLPRTAWLPFLKIALQLCESPVPVSAAAAQHSDSFPSDFIEAIRDTAMMLDNKSDSNAAAKLLTKYIAMKKGVIDFDELTLVARRFPSVWEASKNEVLRAMGSDVVVALSFIKKCRSANLPEAVWGPGVDVFTKMIETPTDKELGDSSFQSMLWNTAVDVPTPNLCQTSVIRYMAAPLTSTAVASSALLAVCKEDSRAFEEKRTVLEPLLLHWFRAAEKDEREME